MFIGRQEHALAVLAQTGQRRSLAVFHIFAHSGHISPSSASGSPQSTHLGTQSRRIINEPTAASASPIRFRLLLLVVAGTALLLSFHEIGKTGITRCVHIIIDHCSMSWSTDECASFYGNTNFTMQWCILSESLWHSIHEKEAHGYGGIWGGSPATFHHNLLAHHSNRTPRLCGSRYSNRADVEKVDLCNNVIYNWTNEGAYGAQGGYYNIMNNYYKLGPASAKDKTHARFFTAYIDDGKNAQDAGVFGYFYVNGNIMDNTCVDLSGEQQKEIASANANNISSTAFKVKNDERTSSDLLLDMRIDILSDYSFMQSATDAYETVLAYAGAWTCGWKDNEYIIPERDKIDRRIVSETANGTYSTNASKGGGYGLIDSQVDTIEKWDEYITATSSLVDTDKDGIPDGWEIAKGLNPNDASDGAKYNLSAAYTNLEVYLNGLVENTFPASHPK